MTINPITVSAPKDKNDYQNDVLTSTLGGAFIGGSAGAAIGLTRKPDIFEYTQTANRMINEESKADKKALNKIAKKLGENKNAELSKTEKELLKFYKLEGKTSKEVLNTARNFDKVIHADELLARAKRNIRATNKKIETLKTLAKDAIDGKTNSKESLAKFLETNKEDFKVVVKKDGKLTFETKKLNATEAIEFYQNRVKAFAQNRDRVLKMKNEINKNASIFSKQLVKSFQAKESTIKDAITSGFKSAKGKKYAIFGALFAGVAAGWTALIQGDKIKHTFVPVPVIVPAKGKNCPECKPCDKKEELKEIVEERKSDKRIELKKAAAELRKAEKDLEQIQSAKEHAAELKKDAKESK